VRQAISRWQREIACLTEPLLFTLSLFKPIFYDGSDIASQE